jgi:hypothetical protein
MAGRRQSNIARKTPDKSKNNIQESDEKRARSPNYTPEDIDLLLNARFKDPAVIERFSSKLSLSKKQAHEHQYGFLQKQLTLSYPRDSYDIQRKLKSLYKEYKEIRSSEKATGNDSKVKYPPYWDILVDCMASNTGVSGTTIIESEETKNCDNDSCDEANPKRVLKFQSPPSEKRFKQEVKVIKVENPALEKLAACFSSQYNGADSVENNKTIAEIKSGFLMLQQRMESMQHQQFQLMSELINSVKHINDK